MMAHRTVLLALSAVFMSACPLARVQDNDNDGYVADADCDDNDPETFPGATEQCDGLDNDCDGTIPLEELDLDNDGYFGCEGDCLPLAADVFPGAPEQCNGIDDDCDGQLMLEEADSDSDGWIQCDYEQWLADAEPAGTTDCDDTNALVHPLRDEGPDAPGTLSNGIDDNCDGIRDCGDAAVPSIRVAAATFMMGAPEDEPGWHPSEALHQVVLTHDFCLAVFETTEHAYLTVTGQEPSYNRNCGSDCPVERTTWHDAARFANAQSTREGLEHCYACDESECVGIGSPYMCDGYRLPTEAEWELAARGTQPTNMFPYPGTVSDSIIEDCPPEGSFAPPSFLDDFAQYCGNSLDVKSPVGQRAPNSFGLYDLAGNVEEWTHDYYAAYPSVGVTVDPYGPSSGEQRAYRGGSFHSSPNELRSGQRSAFLDDQPSTQIGIRLARTAAFP